MHTHTHTHTRRTECMHEGAVVGRWGVCGRERLEGVSAKLILVFFFYVSPLKSARATRTRARARNTHQARSRRERQALMLVMVLRVPRCVLSGLQLSGAQTTRFQSSPLALSL